MITFLDDRDKKDINNKIDDIELKEGASAYEVAVANGFEGSEEEWLESLNGQNGKTAYEYAKEGGFTGTEEEFIQLLVMATEERGSQVKISEVTLFSGSWIGAASPYSQVVNIPGVTENSQVDLTPSVAQLAIFHEKDLAFVTENDGGVVTVYAIGQKPLLDYTVQVTIIEVNYE